jgi:hypothetical protein
MKPINSAVIELRDLQLKTDTRTYDHMDTRPDCHILDLALGISLDQVLIAQDVLANVFYYGPLILEIDRLAADRLAFV